MTAAHCVYDINESKQYVDALDFSAAQNGNTAPYGTVAWDTVRVLSQFTGEVCSIPVMPAANDHRPVS